MRNKDNLFSKNNYDIQLEELLESKGYTDEAKGLILSILYKIESAYNDYKKTKPNVKSKMEIITEIIDTIEHKCDSIIVLGPEAPVGKIDVSKKNKVIKTFPKDTDLLQAIFYMNTPYAKKIESIFDRAVLLALENGRAVNGAEIIRDFNGWSWNNVLENATEQYYNLIYQDLIILIGEENLEKVIKSSRIIDELSIQIKKIYGKVKADKIVSNIVKTSMMIYMNIDRKNKKEIIDYLENKEEELQQLSNKTEYVIKATEKISVNTELICKIDALLNNENLLSKKYSSKKISDKYKDIDSYKIYLIKHKNEILNEITHYKKMMNPFEYVGEKKYIQNEVDNLNEIKLCCTKKAIAKSLIELQKDVIMCIHKKIESSNQKKQLVSLVYQIRYYNFLPLGGKRLKGYEVLKDEIEKIQMGLVNKLKKSKVVDIFSDYTGVNYFIIKYIFETRMVDINKISFRYNFNKTGIDIEYFDEDIMEYSSKLALNDEEHEGFVKRENKKIKIFV